MSIAHADQTSPDASCGLYVHVPFCETKCGYCDFFSVALKGRDTAPLLSRLLGELERRLAERCQRIETIFCGGGTPTILPLDQLARLLRALSSVTDDVSEFTVEANPATVDDAKARLLVSSGVTRVSMGAQSFFPSELETLERIHSPDDIAPSVTTLRRAGVGQVNLDLIFGIPGQTRETWAASLARAIDLDPDHIACYGLTYEPGTRLTAQQRTGRITPCDENLEADMYLAAIDTLTGAGYEQYEISNFAKPGCRCRHNLVYWRNEPFIGVGPSAAGVVDGVRYKNVADVAGYIRMIDAAGHAEVESEPVTIDLEIIEMLMMQLRLVEGLSVSAFRERTGIDMLALPCGTMDRLRDQALVSVSPERLALTRSGMLVADSVIADLAVAVEDKRCVRDVPCN